MKTKYGLGMLLMALVMGTFFTSCEKDDGSEGIQMRMRNSDNGGDKITLLYVDSAYSYLDHNYVVYEYSSVGLQISNSNNFYVSGGYYNYSNYAIACVGNVNNLAKINSIPQSGWTNQIAVQPGQGYIIRHTNETSDYNSWKYYCKYARVYVEEWIEGTSGGIIGAVIRYQDNWKE